MKLLISAIDPASGERTTIERDATPDEEAELAPAPSFADLQAAAVAAITALAAARLAAGAPIGGGLHIAVDDGSRADLGAMATTALAAASQSIDWPESYALGWITVENIRLPLAGPADGLVLAAAVGDWYARVVQRRRTLKDAVLAAADATALAAIDIETGWPD
jgi:hypothetical protein